MDEFASNPDHVELATNMTKKYFLANSKDPQDMFTSGSSAAEVFTKLEAGKKITFKNGNHLADPEGEAKLVMSHEGELKLEYLGR